MRTLLSLAAVAATVPAAVLLAGCTSDDAAARELATATGARARSAPKVRVEPVVQREMVRYLETTTVLESELDIELFPRRAGAVVEIVAEEGDPVEAGQVLARLEDNEEQLAVDEAEVALEEARNAASRATLAVHEARALEDTALRAAQQAERDYARDQRLHDDREVASPLSQQALENSRLERDNKVADHEQAKIAVQRTELEEQNAKIAVRKAEVALQRAEVALDEMRLIAPFEGVVAQRNVRLGDSVGAGEFAYKLTDPLKLRAVFNRPQRELALFLAGERLDADGERHSLQLTAVAEAIPGRSFRGEIVRVSPTIDPLSGNFRVTAIIEGMHGEEEGPSLLPGMLLRLKIATERHPDALVVPKRAVRREGDTSRLFVVEEDRRLREVRVRESFTDDENVEVVPGEPGALEAGDRVVVVGSRDLEEGDEVRIDDGLGPPEATAPGETQEETQQPAADAQGGDAGEATAEAATTDGDA